MANAEPTAGHTVFILGAGFSRAAGAPLMTDFISAMRKAAASTLVTEADRLKLQKALEFRESAAKISDNLHMDLENVEHLFSLFDALDVGGGSGFSSTIPTRAEFTDALLRTLELFGRLTPSVEKWDWRDPGFVNPDSADSEDGTPCFEGDWLYQSFASIIEPSYDGGEYQGDSIISFNYDLILDFSLFGRTLQIDYGLPSETRLEHVHDADAKLNGHIRLYKLHGSANWVHCKVSNKLFTSTLIALEDEPKSSRLAAYKATCPYCRETKERNDRDASHEALIVPPTWNKGTADARMKSVWNAALRDLQAASDIVVIGYSIPETDVFFKYLLAAGLRHGKGTRFYLMNPDEEVANRFRRFLSPSAAESRFTWIRSRILPGSDSAGAARFDGEGIAALTRAIGRNRRSRDDEPKYLTHR